MLHSPESWLHALFVYRRLLLSPLPYRAPPPRRVRLMRGRMPSSRSRASARHWSAPWSELDGANVIVHIESSRRLPFGWRHHALRHQPGRISHIRITLSVWLTPSNRVAILGHELQHAIELAHADATDTAALRRLFTSEGAYAVRTDDYFETREAVRVEKRIRRELQAPTTGRANSSALP